MSYLPACNKVELGLKGSLEHWRFVGTKASRVIQTLRIHVHNDHHNDNAQLRFIVSPR